MSWHYTVNKTIITEKEAKEIYDAYQEYLDAQIINDFLQLKDMRLACKIVKFYHPDSRAFYIDLDEIRDAIYGYIESQLSPYILDHKAKLDINNTDISNMKKGYFWSIIEKNPSLNYEGDVPLCEQLEPLRQLHIKWVNAVHRWHED